MANILDNTGAVLFDEATRAIAYLETITAAAQQQGKFVRQAGAVRQYADCWLKLVPTGGQPFEFLNQSFGGVIPAQFIPAIEAAVREQLKSGPLAGFPVVGLTVAVFDGSSDAAASTTAAFKTAASMAFKAGFLSGGPALLEPVMDVLVQTPEDCLGTVIDDLNRRRGSVEDREDVPSSQPVRASVPLAEMLDYATFLGTSTGGRASFSMAFAQYAQVPSNVARLIIEARKSM
jgi:elongation factor G